MLSNSYHFLPELALNPKPKPQPRSPPRIDEKFVKADPNSTFLNEITEKSIGLVSHRNKHMSLNKYVDYSDSQSGVGYERMQTYQSLNQTIKNSSPSPRNGQQHHPLRYINIKQSKAFN